MLIPPEAVSLSEPPPSPCLHALFEAQVTLHPDAVALQFQDSTLSYRELSRKADRLAEHLRRLGAGPDVLIGLWLEPSLEMLVGLLGILKAGAAYLPIDRSCPAERAAFMLADAGAVALVAHATLAAKLAPSDLPVLLLNSDDLPEPSGQADRPAADATGPDHLAYVIYTSGTTGRPKGTMITHRNVVRLFTRTAHWFGFDEHDTWTLFHSIAFDMSVWEIWGAFLYGGRLVVVDAQVSRAPEAFYRLLSEEKITVLSQTPSAFVQLMAAQEQTAVLPLALRYIVFAGEALEMETLRSWVNRRGDEQPRLINMYGITETTVHVTYRRVVRADLDGGSFIGEPIPDLGILLLDPDMRPAPDGEEGEIYVSGPGLARGYLNRPELTAERFVRHPFSSDPRERLYRSGDLARYRADGELEYLGRIDHQVKIRGHRVELGEIENSLSGHPFVRQAVVRVAKDSAGANTLVAYLASRPHIPVPSSRAVRQHLSQTLSDYMMPARFIAVPELPLTVNGKVDRRALEAIDQPELPLDSDYQAPRTPAERQLAEIWQDVLQRDRIGVRDNFFDLGGHSLLAVIIRTRLSRHLGLEIPLRWIFAHPTIEDLVRHIEAQDGLEKAGVPITPIDRSRPAPMSFAQQGFWLLDQLWSEPSAYNIPFAWHIAGPLDRLRLRRTLRTIITRHEVLRTALREREGTLVQCIADAEELPLPWLDVDASMSANTDKIAVARTVLDEKLRCRFDLAKEPLWKVVCVDLGAEEQVVAFIFHHSIIDEWSLRVFADECQKLYADDGCLNRAGLPALPVQHADFSSWQRQQLQGTTLAQSQAYWRAQLAKLPPPVELPGAKPRPASPSGQGSAHVFQLGGELVTKLRNIARAEETTLFTVLLTAFQVWLHRTTGQNDVVVSTPMTSRTQPETLALLGCFLNTLPIRTRMNGEQGFGDTLRQVRATAAEAFEHAALPFEQIVALALNARDSSRSPLHQLLFVLMEEPRPVFHLDSAETKPLPLITSTCKNDLTLFIEADNDTWDCRIEYSTDILDAASVGRMADQLTLLLHSLAAETDKPINRLDLLPESERRQVVETWNQTATVYPRDRCIHSLFEEQAARTPDAVAIVSGETTLTYRKLNDRADRIAGHLRALGVSAGSLVALNVERSPETVAAVLGILKAGGAYWALEDKIPETRLRLMLTDARPAVLLARSLPSPAWPDDLPHVVLIDDLLAAPAPAGTPAPTVVSAESPAYVNYTSGSAGQPKGVLVPHRGVVRLVKGCDYASLTPAETLLHHSPLSFDASTLELWGALLNGGLVVLMPPGQPSLAEIGDAIRRHQVTTLWLTAGIFHLIVDERLDDLKPLRQLLAGGDVLSPAHVRKCRQAFPGLHLVNGYGPTENTTFTCCHTVTDDTLSAASVPIGRPIANTRVYVLDALLHPVPIGVAGELYVGGDGLASGYLNEPRLNAERFVEAPFLSGERLYRTGDAARWRSDGQLEFLGRLDSQVKIRGFRVEMGEIETVLRSVPGVREAAVIRHPNPAGGQWLVAYVVTDNRGPDDVALLKNSVRAQLPDYMVPDVVQFLSSLPLTANGKIDRHALPEPTPVETPDSTYAPPQSGLETKLAEIWRRLFQRDRIGRHDNFFSLGGHSLLATRLAVEIEKLTGRRVPIAALFQAPTIATLSAMLHGRDSVTSFSSLVPLQPHGSLPALFCVHGWGGDIYGFLHLANALAPDRPVYGLQAVGLDCRSEKHPSVEAMAVHYAREIRLKQPAGPYHLLGYSMGGWIAYAVAQELVRQGCQVGLLGFLETTANARLPLFLYFRVQAPHAPKMAHFYLKHWRVYLQRLHKPPGGGPSLRYWAGRLRHRWGHLTLPHTAPPPFIGPTLPSHTPETHHSDDHWHDLVAHYRPEKYPGNVVYFAGHDSTPEQRSFWKHLVDGTVSIRTVTGGHHDLISPDNIRTFSTSMEQALREAASVR